MMRFSMPHYRLSILFFCCAALFTLFFSQNQALARQVPPSKEALIYSYAPLVKKSVPAVVNIYASKTVRMHAASPFLRDPLFHHFFKEMFPYSGATREKVVNSLGSGVIIRPDGLIATNNHVVQGADEVKIVLHDRREYSASVVLTDPKTDLALLKMETDGERMPFLEVEDSDTLEVGDVVLAIGNPFGVGQTVTSGIVSALARTTVGVADFEFFIQTDAAINPGNSGGALVDMHGRLVGINTAIFTRSGGSLGISFAIPSNMLRTVVASYDNGGKIARPWLGAAVQSVTPEIAHSLGLSAPSGAMVSGIINGSSAAKAGLAIGDVILEIDGRAVEDEKALRYRIATYTTGNKARFKLLRKGRMIELDVPMEPPQEDPPRNETTITQPSPLNGATVANLSPALAHELSLRTYEGVVILGTKAGSIARSLGLRHGDILVTLNGVTIKSVKHLSGMLHTAHSPSQLIIKRGDDLMTLVIR